MVVYTIWRYNHWNCYPEPASFTVHNVRRLGDGDSVLLSQQPAIASPVMIIPNKRWLAQSIAPVRSCSLPVCLCLKPQVFALVVDT